MQEEEKIVQKAKQGEEDAFGLLYDEYLPKIYRFVLLKVGRKADAEDLCHQVFLSAWKNIRTYESRGFPFSSWLYRIAHNSVIDFWRTQKTHIDIELVSAEHFSEEPEMERLFDISEEFGIVRKMLKKLKEEEESLLIMKFVDELPNKEIAEALGKSEGAVRVMQHRALKQLKQHMKEYHEEH